jgi:hypothetical protein
MELQGDIVHLQVYSLQNHNLYLHTCEKSTCMIGEENIFLTSNEVQVTWTKIVKKNENIQHIACEILLYKESLSYKPSDDGIKVQTTRI